MSRSILSTRRKLGRTDVMVPPVIWEVRFPLAPVQIEAATRTGADWFFIPGDAPIESFIQALDPQRNRAIVGVELSSLLSRRNDVLVNELQPLRGRAAIMLLGATANDLKSGRPFQRLARFRDLGLADLLMIEAADTAEAEWFVENSAAHAVSVPYGLLDQRAQYRLLESAAELGTAIMAREPHDPPAWDHENPDLHMRRSFRISNSLVAATFEPLPADVRAFESFSDAMDEAERDRWWTRFSSQVAAPPKLRGGHPPEYGA